MGPPAREIRYPFSFFEHLSSESAQNDPKRPEGRKVFIIVACFEPSQKCSVLPEGCCKNRSLTILIEFSLHFMLAKMCLFPSAGRIFSVAPARFRPGVRTRAVFLEAPFEKRVFAREVLQKSDPMHFRLVFCCCLHRKNVHISSLGLILLFI